jgi:hypothetical protein
VWGDWKYFGAGGDGIFWWYDTQGVTYHPNRMINVWVKKVRADEIVDRVKSGGKIDGVGIRADDLREKL